MLEKDHAQVLTPARKEESRVREVTFVLGCPGALSPAVVRDAGRGYAALSLTWPADDGCDGVERCHVFAEQTNEKIDNGGFLTCWMSNLDRQDETSFAGVVLCQRIRSPLAALQPLALFMATIFVLIVLCIRAKGRKDRVSPLLNRGTEKHSLEHQTPRESMNEKDEHASAAKHDALFDETFWA